MLHKIQGLAKYDRVLRPISFFPPHLQNKSPVPLRTGLYAWK